MTYGNSSEYENAAGELLFGAPRQALAIFEEGLRRFPDDAGLSVGRGMALNALNRPAEARAVFIRVSENHPLLTDALQGLAEAELALGNKTAAAAAARKACDHPGESNAAFVHGMGLLLYRHRLFADAEHCYRRAVAIDRAHGLSWVGLASCLRHQGQRDEAIKLLKDAVEDRLPGCWEAYSYLGCLLCDAGRTPEAINILGKIPLDELRDPAAARRLRTYLDAEKHPERARVLTIIEKRAADALEKLHPGSASPHQRPKERLRKPRRRPYRHGPYQGTVVAGPVHGNLSGLKRILRHAKLIDSRGYWLGHNACLVVAGPILGSGKKGLAALRYLRDIQGTGTQEHGRVSIVLSPSDAAILRSLGETVPLGGCWAAEAGDHLVTAGGVSSEAENRALKERPCPFWRPGSGMIRPSRSRVLAWSLREGHIGGAPTDAQLPEDRTPSLRQIYTNDGPVGVFGLDRNCFVRLNSGLSADGPLCYIWAYGYGEKPHRVEVPGGPDGRKPCEFKAGVPWPVKLNWIVSNDRLYGGHGVFFHHDATGSELLAYADGYPRGMGCGDGRDEVAVYLRKERPEASDQPSEGAGSEIPAPSPDMTWEQIVAEVRSAVEHYFSGRNDARFNIRGHVRAVIGG